MKPSFVIGFAGILAFFRFLFAGGFDLSPDEAYYWFFSRHLQLSYFDHPPMVSYLIRGSTMLFGQHEWAVRLPALIMGIGCSYVTYRLGMEIFKDPKAGYLSVILLNCLLVFSAGMVLMTPDTPQLFFWILTLYFSYRAVFGNKGRDWFLTGVFLGLGLLSKYTVILFVPCLILFLLMTPPYRHLLISWRLGLALGTAVLFFSPVIWWNYQHQWISFLFQLHHGTDSRHVQGFKYFLDFLGGQAGIFSPFIFLGFFWAIVKSFKVGRKKNLEAFSFLFWSVFPVLAFFMYQSFHTKIEANWAGFAQAGSIILLGGFLNQKIRDRGDSTGILWIAGGMISFSFILMMTVHIQSYLKILPLPVERDRTYDLTGWEEMRAVHSVYPQASSVPLLTTTHTLVGEASFYLKNPRVFQWGAPQRLTDLTRADPPPTSGSPFLLLTVDGDQFTEETKSHFQNIRPLIEIPVIYKGLFRQTKFRTYHFYEAEYLPENLPALSSKDEK